MKRAAGVGAVLAIAGAGIAVTATPAFAGALPSCVSVSHHDGDVNIFNHCYETVPVKIIWSRSLDGPCVRLNHLETYGDSKSWPAKFDKVVTC